jgi:hypothetical protein
MLCALKPRSSLAIARQRGVGWRSGESTRIGLTGRSPVTKRVALAAAEGALW